MRKKVSTSSDECSCSKYDPLHGLGYMAAHTKAKSLLRRGYQQRACSRCGLLTIWIKPRAKVGKKGKKKLSDKAKAKTLYFKLHHFDYSEDHALCQICGGTLRKIEADPCHKRKASLGKSEKDGSGGEVEENIVAGHRKCHQWADETRERRLVMEASPINVKSGGVIQWTSEQKKSLRIWTMFPFSVLP